MELPPYAEGSYRDRNTGRACWSCAGLMDHAPGPRCIYRDAHRADRAVGTVLGGLSEAMHDAAAAMAETKAAARCHWDKCPHGANCVHAKEPE